MNEEEAMPSATALRVVPVTTRDALLGVAPSHAFVAPPGACPRGAANAARPTSSPTR